MNANTLRSYGLSLIFLALATGSLGRTLHVSDAIKMTFSAVSVLFSLAAIALFIKARSSNRRSLILTFVVMAILATALPLLLLSHR